MDNTYSISPQFTKAILTEATNSVKSISKLDTQSIMGYRMMLSDDNAYETYKSALFEHVSNKREQTLLMEMADNMRLALLENYSTTYNFTPYETLSLPLLSIFWPKLVAKRFVTNMPIDEPDVMKPFLKPYFMVNGVKKYAPVMDSKVSYGPEITRADNSALSLGDNDVFGIFQTKFSPSEAYSASTTAIERNFVIYKIGNSGASATVDQIIRPTADGDFHAEVTVGGATAKIGGHINWSAGIVTMYSTASAVDEFYFTGKLSLEQNVYNSKVNYEIDKIRLTVEDQEISADWTIPLARDAAALWDLDWQSQVLSNMGEQQALDVDNRILGDLFDMVQYDTGTAHKDTFDKTPPSGYNWGPTYWYRNVIQKLNKLSAVVSNATRFGGVTTIGANPLDADVFESLKEFGYKGSALDGGDLGFAEGTLKNKWEVLISSVIPQGKMLLAHVPTDIKKAIYIFAPYQPTLLHPFPAGRNPSLTIISSNAYRPIRPEGLATLEIIES